MEGYHEVYLGDKPAGKLRIERDGLYYRIVCHCYVPEDTVYRLFAVMDSHRENLGVVVPEGDGYFLERKIPVKRLNHDAVFSLSARSVQDTDKFVPIYPEEPFSYIVHLENAFLDVRGGQIGACWKQKPGAE